MPETSFEHGAEARRALRLIVADPAYGPAALSDPQVLSNLLRDLLPDAPRETGLLTAAAEHDVAGRLRDQVSQGLAATSAIRLAAASFAESTAFTDEACAWAAGELAVASGLAGPGEIQAGGMPEPGAGPTSRPVPSEAATERPAPVSPGTPFPRLPDSTEPLAADASGGRGTGERDGGPRWGRIGLWALGAVALAAIAVTVALLLRPPTPVPQRVANPARPGRSSPPSPGRRSGPSSPRSALTSPPTSPATSPARSAPSPPASSPARSGPGSPAPPPAPAAPGPRSVVLAYIAAINRRDWPRVWQLGGKNFSPSYADMIAGYRLTARDVITSLAVNGDTVTARMLAYETTGPVQTYLLSYIVRGGVIVGGHATLLGTSG